MKRATQSLRRADNTSFDSTYEGLKRVGIGWSRHLGTGFDSTYEGLKHVLPVSGGYGRNSFDSTYEGLKPGGGKLMLGARAVSRVHMWG